MQAVFEHPDGVLYFEQFWEKDPKYSIHLIKGTVSGKGPWRIGQCTVHVLGCNHTHPGLCEVDAYWHQENLLNPQQFAHSDIIKIANEKGAIIPKEMAINHPKYQIKTKSL